MSRALPVSGLLPLAIPRRLAPWWACALVVAWAMLMAGTHPAQFADSIEEYNWAHSLEWGYWKHPPLTTWMMRGAIALIGVSHWTAPVLAAACRLATVAFLWQLARMLLPPRAAELAILLWPLHQVLTFRAEVYNHNTTVMLFSAAIAWAAVRAAASGRTRDWVLAGVVAGLGLLAKYQAFVTIMGALVALGMTGRLRSAAVQRQVGLAALAASVVFLPHVLWLAQASFTTFSYVEQQEAHLHLFSRLPALLRFFSLQVPMFAGMLLVAAAAMYWPPRGGAAADPQHGGGETRAWMIGLVAVPLLVVAVAVLGGGLIPQRMWGLHTLLFLPLWLAWRIERARPGEPLVRRAAIAAAALTIANIGYAALEAQRHPDLRARFRAVDRLLPATDLAQAALADWHRATRCPLRFVTGPPLPAGLVSVYSGEYPAVLEDGDFAKTPWVRPDELRAAGAIEIHGPSPAREVPPNVPSMRVPPSTKDGGAPSAIWWQVIRPGSACG